MRINQGIRRAQLQPARRARIVLAAVVGLSVASTVLLEGCAAVSIGATAASVAATAAATAVDVGVGAVKVTGKVIGKGVDLVSGGPAAPASSARP